MSNLVIKDLEMYQELTNQEAANPTGGEQGDAIRNQYEFLNSLLGPYDPVARQRGAEVGAALGSVLDVGATYGPPGTFSEILYGQVMPFILNGNW